MYNCSWSKGFQGKNKSSEFTYRKAIQICDEGIFTWANSLFLCNPAPIKTPLNLFILNLSRAGSDTQITPFTIIAFHYTMIITILYLLILHPHVSLTL